MNNNCHKARANLATIIHSWKAHIRHLLSQQLSCILGKTHTKQQPKCNKKHTAPTTNNQTYVINQYYE